MIFMTSGGCSVEILFRIVDGEAGDFSLPGDDGAHRLDARESHHGLAFALHGFNDFVFFRGIKLDVGNPAVHGFALMNEALKFW